MENSMTSQPKPLDASPELRAIASTYLSEGSEVGYQLAIERICTLETHLGIQRDALEARDKQLAALREARDRLEAKLIIMEADWDNGGCAGFGLVRKWAELWWPVINEHMTPEHRSFRWAVDFEAELRKAAGETK